MDINFKHYQKLRKSRTKLFGLIRQGFVINRPKGLWHTLNHYIIEVLFDKIYVYNEDINEFTFKTIVAFLVTLYEYDSFSKMMIAVGLPHFEDEQLEFYKKLNVAYILKWIPGMFVSRYIMVRDFVRSTKAKSHLVNYNIKYMKTTINRLHNLPDILILNRLHGVGSIVAKEAIDSKIFTIGLTNTENFPYKISYRLFGNVEDFNFIKSFIYMILYIIKKGSILFYKKNFERTEKNKGDFNENFKEKFKKSFKLFLASEIRFDSQFLFKEFLINSTRIKKSQTKIKKTSCLYILLKLVKPLKYLQKKSKTTGLKMSRNIINHYAMEL